MDRISPIAVGEPDILGRPHPIGEHHHKSRLSDKQIEAIRDEYDAGQLGEGPKIGYRALAKKYETSKRTIRDIVNYKRRNTWAEKWHKPRRKKRNPNLGQL